MSWERNYKWEAHLRFEELLNHDLFSGYIERKEYERIAEIAVRIESRTNLLFSFEKMALRDAVSGRDGAALFARGLYDYLYAKAAVRHRFENFVEIIRQLPRKQTRVLTWPLVTVFGFLAKPREHIFLKPLVTKAAALKYQFDFNYKSNPGWETYQSLLDFAELVKNDTREYKPRDYIDLQSFIWIAGSEEYPE